MNLIEDEDGAPYPEGVQAIARERGRQITELGYDAEHDAGHTAHDLMGMALAYLGVAYWQPNGRVERPDLVKAGALVAAAIDRLDDEKVEAL